MIIPVTILIFSAPLIHQSQKQGSKAKKRDIKTQKIYLRN